MTADGRPHVCEGETPHALRWLTPDFAICEECELLYVWQSGRLVWLYDVWTVRLAYALAGELDRREGDPSAEEVESMLEGICEGG